MIHVEGLTRRYGDFAAVDGVSFEIAPGEVVGLLGHNGAGKTTIMKMLTGFLEPSSGTVQVNGTDVCQAPLIVQAQMGYLPESPPIYPELSVVDYLTYTAQLRGLDAAAAVPQAIAATQLEAKTFDVIDTLSRGYKQRLGVAQAILHRPKYLILDEPSNGLDPNQIREMRSLIKSLSENATVILSTHIMQEVNAVCDRVLILRGGKLVVDERLETLRRASRIALHTDTHTDVEQVVANVAEITSVQALEPGRYQLDFSGDPQGCVAAVAKAMVDAGAPIYQISLLVRDLEGVFAEVNEGAPEGDRDAA